jgi:hypothetical protein
MDNLVSMDRWNIARIPRRDMRGDPYLHHRSTCDYCASRTGGVLHACQRGNAASDPKAQAVRREAEKHWGR